MLTGVVDPNEFSSHREETFMSLGSGSWAKFLLYHNFLTLNLKCKTFQT